ncbi:MAG: type III-B CRISPR module RAMP protein Cmr1 [Egibacteraceae bacterium]
MPVDRRWHDVLVDTVTPLAMGGGQQRGSDGAEPLRARSVRGLLRTWTRFLAGSRMTPQNSTNSSVSCTAVCTAA